MKKLAKRSSIKVRSSQKEIRWFGIRIIHIAFYVIALCLIVCGLLVKQAFVPQTVVLATHDEAVSVHEITPFAGTQESTSSDNHETLTRHCVPRPACLDSHPRCLIAEPAGGWCELSTTPAPTVTSAPHGCFYKKQCTTISCPSGVDADECLACKKTLICPNGIPHPSTEISSVPDQEGENAGTPAANAKSTGSWWDSLLHGIFH